MDGGGGGETALHEVVRRGWSELLAHLTLPPRVHTEVRRHLGCGQLARGFVQVECTECRESRLVAFSCKGSGWCPSCAAKRALETSTHLGAVLPRVGYRQWTLTLPRGLRWVVVQQPGLVRAVERRLVRAVWRWRSVGLSGHDTPGEGPSSESTSGLAGTRRDLQGQFAITSDQLDSVDFLQNLVDQKVCYELELARDLLLQFFAAIHPTRRNPMKKNIKSTKLQLNVTKLRDLENADQVKGGGQGGNCGGSDSCQGGT